MTTVTKPVLIGCDQLDITEQHEPSSVIAALDAVTESSTTARAGFVWLFRLGSADEDPALAVGVRGEIGAVAWYEGHDELVPVNGLNGDDADHYWTWFGHEAPMPPRSELPIADVRSAFAEWISTHQRPACIDWTAA